MGKYSQRVGDAVKYHFWLTFDKDGSVRMSRQQPSVTRHERAVAMTAVLPLSLFNQPELSAKITVPGEPNEPIQIDLEAASTALKTALGCDIDLRVTTSEAEPE